MVTEAEYDRVQTLLDEYAQRRGKLLNEKAALEKLINDRRQAKLGPAIKNVRGNL